MLGIFKGLSITLRHFIDTYINDLGHFPHRYAPGGVYRRRRPGEKGAFTVQYPEERLQMFPRFRGVIMQLTDPQTGIPKCTACGICARSCPVGIITVERAEEKRGEQWVPKTYTVDISVCLFCGLCVDACPFEALYHSHEFEISSYGRGPEDLLYDLNRLLELGNKYAPNGIPPAKKEAN
jgi:NADH-quinone oxidoreductase subunit I